MSDVSYYRFVALGDSQTEGLNDGADDTGFRGWADRFAEHLAAVNPELHYANLAVRGRLTRDVLADQLPAALALRPDLVSVVVGMNDVLRVNTDLSDVLGDLDTIYARLTDEGITVVTTTFPAISKIAPMAKRLEPRALRLNDAIRSAATKYDLVLVDLHGAEAMTDLRYWSADRIHASSLGHAAFAAAGAEALRLPGSDDSWSRPLPPLPPHSALGQIRVEVAWVRAFLLPWFARRIQGKSSGDGRTAKRPTLAPVAGS